MSPVCVSCNESYAPVTWFLPRHMFRTTLGPSIRQWRDILRTLQVKRERCCVLQAPHVNGNLSGLVDQSACGITALSMWVAVIALIVAAETRERAAP